MSKASVGLVCDDEGLGANCNSKDEYMNMGCTGSREHFRRPANMCQVYVYERVNEAREGVRFQISREMPELFPKYSIPHIMPLRNN